MFEAVLVVQVLGLRGHLGESPLRFLCCQPLLLGDLNAKITKDDEGNTVALSTNGELLASFLSAHNLIAVNHHENCSGKWTRQNRSNAEEKSVLDYMLIHENMSHKVTEVTIDEDLCFTPYNVIKKGKGGEFSVKYTDHNAMVMLVIDLFKKPKSVVEKPVGWWKLTDDGLDKFRVMTDHYDAVPFDGSKGVQENFDVMSSHLEGVMLDCFKKIYPKSNHGHLAQSNVRRTQKILQDIAKEGKIQRNVAHHYLELLHDKIVQNVHRKKSARIAEVAVSLT